MTMIDIYAESVLPLASELSFLNVAIVAEESFMKGLKWENMECFGELRVDFI